MNKFLGTSSASLINTSLGKSMAVFLVVTALAVTGTNVWSLWFSWKQRLAERENDALNLSISLAKQAEDAFLQVDITLADAVRQLRQNGNGYASSPAFTRQIREQHGKLPQLHGLFIYDAKGNWVATSGNYIPAKASNADRDYFIWHRTHTSTNLLVSRVIRSRSTGDLVIPVSVRLNDESGQFAGVALATVRVDYFRHYYSYYILGGRDVLGLILADTSVLYVRPLADSVINQSLSSSPLFKTALKTSDSGSATWRSSLDGVERIYGYARLQQYPLIVTAGFDRDKIRKEWLSANMTDAILNLILLVMIACMGIFLLKQVRANIRNQIELTQVRDELTTINHTLQSLALIDGLTGLANRRQFDAVLEQSLQSEEPVSLIMIDIDYFKLYNDSCGHVAGDICLKKVGRLLKGVTHRHTDLVARYGGEEFAIILPFTGESDAKKVAERAIITIREAGIIHLNTELPGKVVTISAGYASVISGGKQEEGERLKERADEGLYKAKRSGRNCAKGYK